MPGRLVSIGRLVGWSAVHVVRKSFWSRFLVLIRPDMCGELPCWLIIAGFCPAPWLTGVDYNPSLEHWLTNYTGGGTWDCATAHGTITKYVDVSATWGLISGLCQVMQVAAVSAPGLFLVRPDFTTLSTDSYSIQYTESTTAMPV